MIVEEALVEAKKLEAVAANNKAADLVVEVMMLMLLFSVKIILIVW